MSYRDELLLTAKEDAQELADQIEKQRAAMKKMKEDLEKQTIKRYKLCSVEHQQMTEFNIAKLKQQKLD